MWANVSRHVSYRAKLKRKKKKRRKRTDERERKKRVNNNNKKTSVAGRNISSKEEIRPADQTDQHGSHLHRNISRGNNGNTGFEVAESFQEEEKKNK